MWHDTAEYFVVDVEQLQIEFRIGTFGIIKGDTEQRIIPQYRLSIEFHRWFVFTGDVDLMQIADGNLGGIIGETGRFKTLCGSIFIFFAPAHIAAADDAGKRGIVFAICSIVPPHGEKEF